MATEPICDPCCQNARIANMQSVEGARNAVFILLCEILAAVEGGGGGGGSNVNLTGINGTAPSVGAGAVDAGTLRTTLAAATTVGLAAGSAIVGNVRIDQTTPGTTNGVQVNAALPAGSAIIGNVRIDQTTPGTTNGVQLNASSAIVGNVRIDQTTLGTTNGITAVAATIGGFTPGRVSGGLTTTVTSIKSSAQGKLAKLIVGNPNNTNAFVQVFNVATAGAVTLGSTAPVQSYFIPPFSGMVFAYGEGDDYSAGIQIAATTTEAGSSALTTPLTVNYSFK